jgi:hypothetical protein
MEQEIFDYVLFEVSSEALCPVVTGLYFRFQVPWVV